MGGACYRLRAVLYYKHGGVVMAVFVTHISWNRDECGYFIAGSATAHGFIVGTDDTRKPFEEPLTTEEYQLFLEAREMVKDRMGARTQAVAPRSARSEEQP